MKIQEFETYPYEEKTYNIKIELEEDLNTFEIAKCFEKQYPKLKCVITNLRIKEIVGEIVIVGLRLK